MKWMDVSAPLSAGIAVWPGDASFEFRPAERIADGGPCNLSTISMSAHCGTHVDAPWHFEDDGKRLHEVDTSVFFGEARVIDLTGRPKVSERDLGDARLPPRVLLKTDNSARSLDAAFKEDYVALTEEAARRMVDDGVRLVGIDYLSVAPFSDPAPVHHILLQAEVFIVEGLRLADVPAGMHVFTVLPLAIAGADGAPARAFVGLA